jgi:hypothetical protein
MSLTEPVLIGPSAGRTVTKSSGSSTELKLSGQQADGGWAVVEWHLRAGDEPPIHTHTRADETLYVLDGSITAFVGDQRIDVEAGSYGGASQECPAWTDRTWRRSPAAHHTLEPAGGEYSFVPRDKGDADPERFGIVLHDPCLQADIR